MAYAGAQPSMNCFTFINTFSNTGGFITWEGSSGTNADIDVKKQETKSHQFFHRINQQFTGANISPPLIL